VGLHLPPAIKALVPRSFLSHCLHAFTMTAIIIALVKGSKMCFQHIGCLDA